MYVCVPCLCRWMILCQVSVPFTFKTIEFSRHLITKHLWAAYACIDATGGRQQSPRSRLQLFLPLLKHTGTIRIGPKYSRILSSDSGMKLKSLIFFLHARSRSISPDWDVIFSCHWAFSSLAQHPDWLPAGDPSLTARLAGEQLLLPRRVYLRLAMRIAIIYPSPTPPEKKRNRQEGKGGKDERGKLIFFFFF